MCAFENVNSLQSNMYTFTHHSSKYTFHRNTMYVASIQFTVMAVTLLNSNYIIAVNVHSIKKCTG